MRGVLGRAVSDKNQAAARSTAVRATSARFKRLAECRFVPLRSPSGFSLVFVEFRLSLSVRLRLLSSPFRPEPRGALWGSAAGGRPLCFGGLGPDGDRATRTDARRQEAHRCAS